MHRKTFYIVTLILLTAQIISKQVVAQSGFWLQGKVLDEKKKPVAFATVALKDKSAGTICDKNGVFSFHLPIKKQFELIISSVGYETNEITVKNTGEKSISITAKLKLAVNALQQVTVKAKSKSDQLRESGFSVSSINTQELQIKSIELNAVLDKTPGVKVRQNGGLGSSTSYNINGLSGQSVRIFIDGVPAESLGSSYSINSLPVSLIERVDVYKGVVPIEFGNDAMGGVINIVTKKLNRNSLSASYSYGSFNTHRADLNGAWRNIKTGLTTRLTAFYNYSDNNYEIWSDEIKIKDYNQFLPDGSRNPDYSVVTKKGVRVRRFNDAYLSYGAKVDMGITQKSWTDQFMLSLNLSEQTKESQHGPRMIIPYGERFSEGKTAALSANYMKDSLLFDGLSLTANLQVSRSQSSLTDTTTNSYDWYGNIIPPIQGVAPLSGEGGTPSLNVDNNTSYNAQFAASYVFTPEHTIGVNYSYNKYLRSSDDELQEAETRSFGTTSTINKQITGFTYQNVLFSQKLKTSVFAKHYLNILAQRKVEYINAELDTINYSRPAGSWGYGATLSFAPSQRVRINASAEKAVRLVNANEVFGNISNEVIESPDLEPEKSININLGGMFTLLKTGTHKLDLSTTLFFRDTYDRIRRNVVIKNEDSYSFHENIGHVQSKGIEAQIDYYNGQRLHVMAQAYYLDSRFLEAYAQDGSDNLNYKSREPNMPYLTANTSVSYSYLNLFSYNDRLTLSWDAAYVHEFNFDWDILGNQNKPTIPTQLINNLSLSYRFSNQRLAVSIDSQNIFDQLAFDNYAIQKPGRAFYGKLSYRFL